MKKIFLTTSLLSILSMPAMAEVKWFVGGGLGYATPVLSDTLDELIDEDYLKDDSGTLSFNLMGGMRFGERDKIYNGGVSATYSYMADLVQVKDGYYSPYFIDGTLDFSTLYFSYDNYIRLSGDSEYRTDFVASVGLGMGWISESVTSGGYTASLEDEGLIFILKFGFVTETKIEGLGLYANMNIVGLNAEDEADLQGSVGFDFGVKYTF